MTTTKQLGKNRVLRLRLSRGGLELRLRAEPIIEERQLELAVHVTTLGKCGLEIMLGNQGLALQPPSLRPDPKAGQTLWIKLDYEDLYSIARASRVVVRACEEDVRLEQHDLTLLREFALRLIEELAANGTSTPDDELDDVVGVMKTKAADATAGDATGP